MSKAIQQTENRLHSEVSNFVLMGDMHTKTLAKCMELIVGDAVDLVNSDELDADLIGGILGELRNDVVNLCSVINLVEESKEYYGTINLLNQ